MPSPLQISGPIALGSKPRLTAFQRFRADPCDFLIEWLDAHQPPLKPMRPGAGTKSARLRERSKDEVDNQITVVCISDTHNTTLIDIPPGDVLLHAGDLTNKGTFKELQAQLTWLDALPHPHKIVIAGNHDALLDESFAASHPERIPAEDVERRDQLKWGAITYLDNSSTKLIVRGRSITIYGSPMTPQCGTFAFQYLPIRDVWKNTIPDGTDIVLTHGPPKNYLDQGGKGCCWLLRELWRTRPRLVVCGHIHGGRGRADVAWAAAQRGRDFGGLLGVVRMGVAVWWGWIASAVVGRTREGRTTIVNAAVLDGGRGVEVVEV